MPGGTTGGVIPKPRIPSIPFYVFTPAQVVEDPADWRKWWEYNQEAYLDLDSRLHGSLSLGEASPGADAPKDYESWARARLEETLRGVIEKAGGSNAYVSSAVLALAGISEAKDAAGLDPYVEFYLHEGTDDLRGAAALALAIEGRPGTLHALESLLADDTEGRQIAKAERVPVILRAYSAYALGLAGSRTSVAEERTQIARALFAALQGKDVAEEIRVASVIALGLVPVADKLGPEGCDCGGLGHDPESCRLSQIAWLCEVLGDDKQPVSVRVHVPTAIARLSSDMPEEVRVIVAEALLPVLEKGAKEYGPVRQSCVLALGEIARPGESEIDRRIRATLQRTAGFGEEASRRLALVALARGAGKPGARDSAVRDADIAFHERRVAADSESAGDIAALGALYLARGRATGSYADVERAERLARRSLARRTVRNAASYGLLTSALLARHAFVEAREAARHAVELSPGDPAPLAQLAEVELELGDYDAANLHFAAIHVGRDQFTVAARVARWHEIMGRPDSARLLLARAARAAERRDDLPRDQVAWFHYRLGDLERRLGELPAADAALQRAIALAPSDAPTLSALAQLALARGALAEAVAFGERATAIVLEPTTLGVMSEAYQRMGDTTQAARLAQAMRTAALRQPGAIHRAWGLFLLDHGTPVDARRVLARAREERRTRHDVYGDDLLAWALHRTGDVAGARLAMRRALRLGTRDVLLERHAASIGVAAEW